jgi:alpha-glucosidase (family GH31 glycosyl hydrolase)
MKSKNNLYPTCRILSVIALIFVIGLTGCQSKYPAKILNTGDSSYASFKIDNPYGAPVTISSGEDFGGIGYELKENIIWVKGQPEIKSESEGNTVYTWENAGQKVVMQIADKGRDKNITLKLDSSEEQPAQWFLNIAAGNNEYYTGIFERVVDGPQDESWKKGITTALNLRGERVEVKLKPTVSAYAPFYISSENYGISVNGTWPGVVDFCKANPNLVQISFEGPEFVFSLMMDETPAGIVKRRTLETGPPFKAPKWAFGPWRWRDDHFHQKEYFDGSKVHAPYNSDLVEDILMMEAYDIPCTAYWIDRPWGIGSQGYDDFIVDAERLPEFEKMIEWLNNKDVELMIWIAPWVMGDMAKTAKERGYNLEIKKMEKPKNPMPGALDGIGVRKKPDEKGVPAFTAFKMPEEMVLMDYTNPEACEWWAGYVARMAKMGIKGFKLDRADGEILCDSLHLITHNGKTYRENYNDYARQYVKATYDAVKPVLDNNFVLFPRVQYTGSAKYGAMWAGDTGSPAEGLRSAIIGMQRCSVMGYPLWGSDTGGYPKQLIREVTVRWLGFSCFSPIMEVGPTNNLGFWGMDYEPSFDKELLAAWRFYAKLRMSLMDYVYDMAEIAGETGMPVARPLFLEYPEQKESWENWETYKFGDDILVSAIWEEGKTSQGVYLPAGETWINLWNNEELEGGQIIEVEAPLHQIPVFLRKGSALQLPDLNSLYEESVNITSERYAMNDLEKKEGWQ